MICRPTCRRLVTHQLQLGEDVAASALMTHQETIIAAMTAAAVCCVDYFSEQVEPYLRLPAVLWCVTSGQRGVHGGGFAFLLGLHRTFWSIGQT